MSALEVGVLVLIALLAAPWVLLSWVAAIDKCIVMVCTIKHRLLSGRWPL